MGWLVIKRREGQRIRVRTPSGDVWLTVVDAGAGWARLGVSTEPRFEIAREELLDKKSGDEAPGGAPLGRGTGLPEQSDKPGGP